MDLINGIHDAFKLLTLNFKGLTLLTQSAGAIIILAHTSSKMFKAFTSTGKVFDKDGLTPYDILRPLALILFIMFLNPIFHGIETISQLILENSSAELKQITEAITLELAEEEAEAFENLSWYKKIFQGYTKSTNFLWNFIFSNFFRLIIFIIDLLIIPTWYITRYFHLIVFKFFGPLVIAFSMFESTKGWSVNLMKVFARAALAIIPLFFVQALSNYLQEALPSIMNTAIMSGSASQIGFTKGGYTNIILFFLVVVKSRLCKESFALMDKIIP